ncbi:hypothetical protein ACMZ4X_02124 [Achromobacter marplatensis]
MTQNRYAAPEFFERGGIKKYIVSQYPLALSI